MKHLLTPKQVARAIGVSESSVKRWCDRELIPTVKTPGGHRRLPVDGVLAFLRSSHHQLVRPEVLGLPVVSGQGPRVLGRAAEQYFEALLAADEERCRQIVYDLYLVEHRLNVICDRVISPALHRVGEWWQHGQLEIYQERLACEITRQVLYGLQLALPPSPPGAPLAIGATPARDPYVLATRMAELVLKESRWRALSLGCALPLETLAAAVRQKQPRLFWLSVSHIEDRSRFLEGYDRFYRTASQAGVAVIVGGRALTEEVRTQMRYSSYGDHMQHLDAFAATLGSLPANTSSP